MTTIKCTNCGHDIELTEALTQDIEKTVLAAEHAKHATEIERVKKEAAETTAKSILEVEAKAQVEAAAKVDLKLQTMQKDAEETKKDNEELRKQLTAVMQDLRESKKAKENAELEMQKKLAEEEGKIREEATKLADERQRLNLAAKEKTITDLQKALDEAQRKAAQGSQQLQGEIMELDFESALASAFRDDLIEPVAKGTKGGDIRHTVRSNRGTLCGVILWEIKRTKNWTDGWIPKLKEDVRAERANVPIIITEVMPKQIAEDMGNLEGVWICKPQLAIVLATLLRKGLLDVGLQKALAENRGTKEEALYTFVTSHEFVQQIESMVETYREMTGQVSRERVAYEKFWAQREKQAQRLLLGTANIIGSMQGHIGQASMLKIKGLELLGSGEDEDSEDRQDLRT
jgi:hypothetical protein